MREDSNSGELPVAHQNNTSNEASTSSRSSTGSHHTGENEHGNTGSGPHSNLNEFFDSYVSEINHTCPDEAASDCSDSISRYDGNRGHSFQQHDMNDHVQIRSSRNGSVHTRPNLARDSSLATLIAEKRISDSRRTFCLFVTFDLILTTILWVIMCGTSSGGDKSFFDIIVKQVTEYNKESSMFDVVCLAALRFAFLELTYALLWIKHWWPVAVSTAVSDILLVLKMFPIFSHSSSSGPLTKAIPMTIVLLLTNFIITWIEVWLIDFKVLPEEERSAERTLRRFLQGQPNHGYTADEATPLIGPYQSRRSQRRPPSSFYTAAQSDRLSFHTVLDSEYDDQSGNGLRGNVFPIPISAEDAVYVEQGKDALNTLWSSYNNKTIWKLDKQLENGDTLYTTNIPEYGKTFRIDATIRGASPQTMFQEIILKGEDLPKWNPSVSEVKMLKRIGQQTAISLEVSAPAGKGLIQSRDFVTVRRVDKIDNSYISAGVSTDYPIPDSDRIRGVNGPTGFIITPIDGEFAATKFTWILNTSLKGSLPQYLVNSNLTSTMINFVKHMKAHLGLEE